MLAAHSGNTYTTTTEVDRVGIKTLTLGATLPAGAHVASVKLDGKPVQATSTTTTRGLEVTVSAKPSGHHVLTVTTA